MDYNHGTGHGVGYLLNIHEGPQGFRWKSTGKNEEAVFEPGMITSNEPGMYLEGKFGVRLENMIVCVEGETNQYGRFLHFENLTMVPFDLDAIVVDLLTEREKELLNAYHAQVRETLLPRLNAEDGAWLVQATRAV
jgi:Xaa-Pro aminopeptidase